MTPDSRESYDYSGISEKVSGTTEPPFTVGRTVAILAIGIVGLCAAAIGIVTAAIGEREVSPSSRIDPLTGTATEPGLLDLVLVEFGRTLQFGGALMVAAAVVMGITTILRRGDG